MANKYKILERCYKKKTIFHSSRYKKVTTSYKYNIFHTSALAGTTSKASTLYKYSDASISLSAKKLKLNVSNRGVSDNESHFDSIEANIYKNILDNSQIEEVLNDNIDKYDNEINSMNGESISNFDTSRFYEERDSYYLLIDSKILENIIDLFGKYLAQR